jgi:hypothetical protein
MPKKTKKEKLIAEARRIIQESHTSGKSLSPVEKTVNQHELEPKTSYQWASNKTSNLAKNQNDDLEFAAIRKDLLKTIILAGTAVAIELALFWKFR